MRMDKEVLKQILKACEAAIKKLDKENKTFIAGTDVYKRQRYGRLWIYLG